MYPLAAPLLRVVRMEESTKRDRAVKGALHNFASSSCTSSNRERSGQGGGFHARTMLVTAHASMAANSELVGYHTRRCSS